MTTSISLQPVTVNASTLSLGGVNYEDAISSAVFTPTVKSSTFTAINSNTVTSQTPSTWTLDLTLAQDFETTGALADYLHENEGQTVVAVLTQVADGHTFTANVTIAPGAIGDDAGNIATSKVSLGSTKPVIAAPSGS